MYSIWGTNVTQRLKQWSWPPGFNKVEAPDFLFQISFSLRTPTPGTSYSEFGAYHFHVFLFVFPPIVMQFRHQRAGVFIPLPLSIIGPKLSLGGYKLQVAFQLFLTAGKVGASSLLGSLVIKPQVLTVGVHAHCQYRRHTPSHGYITLHLFSWWAFNVREYLF